MNQIKHIRLDKLIQPEFDARLSTNEAEDFSLMESIKELGILEPLLVKETENGFEIIAGNRRYTQGGRAGLAAAPCIVINCSGSQADKIKIHENLKRLPLSHVDQAYTFAHLIKEYNLTETQVSVMVGKSIAYISQHLCLLQSDDDLVQSVQDGKVNFSVARELMLCKDEDERSRFLKFVKDNGATVEVVRNWVRESNIETESVEKPVSGPSTFDQSIKVNIPLYPCHACETPITMMDLKMVRLCAPCHKLIFSEIEELKFKERSKMSSKPS